MTAAVRREIRCEPCADNPDVPEDALSLAIAYVIYPPVPGYPRGRYLPDYVCDLCLRYAVNAAIADGYSIIVNPLESAP